MKKEIREDSRSMDNILQQYFRHLEEDPDLPASTREAWGQDLSDFAAFVQGRSRESWICGHFFRDSHETNGGRDC